MDAPYLRLLLYLQVFRDVLALSATSSYSIAGLRERSQTGFAIRTLLPQLPSG